MDEETLRKLRVVAAMRPPSVSSEAMAAMLLAVALEERDKDPQFDPTEMTRLFNLLMARQTAH